MSVYMVAAGQKAMRHTTQAASLSSEAPLRIHQQTVPFVKVQVGLSWQMGEGAVLLEPTPLQQTAWDGALRSTLLGYRSNYCN